MASGTQVDHRFWLENIKPLRDKLQLGVTFNCTVEFNSEGAAAVLELLTMMANKLDTAAARDRRLDWMLVAYSNLGWTVAALFFMLWFYNK